MTSAPVIDRATVALPQIAVLTIEWIVPKEKKFRGKVRSIYTLERNDQLLFYFIMIDSTELKLSLIASLT